MHGARTVVQKTACSLSLPNLSETEPASAQHFGDMRVLVTGPSRSCPASLSKALDARLQPANSHILTAD